jgi:small ligand-binding sensory domain FIST
MKRFPHGHATHPQWPMAAGLVLAQLRAQMALPEYASAPTLALLYITDHYAADAQDILDHLGAELPGVTDWAGTVGVGVSANNAEYFDEPAMSVMLCELPTDQVRVFSGVAPLAMGFEAHTALVHADGGTVDLPDLLHEMAERTDTGYLFGGLSASRGRSVQFAVSGDGNIRGQGAARGVFSGGLSGVAFGPGVRLISRVTQGCQPLSAARRITGAERNLVTEIDGRPALDSLLDELGVTLEKPESALAAIRQTLVGLVRSADAGRVIARPGGFGSDVLVRHIIGLDPARRGIAVSDMVEEGMELSFCRRNPEAARADLVRICAEIREELEPAELGLSSFGAPLGDAPPAASDPALRIAGAVYVSCSGRGGEHLR